MTTWLPVAEAPDYLVSDEGGVRSPRGLVLKPQANGRYGYLKVQLGRGMQRYVHRLVAAAHIGDIAGMDIEHRDGNVANNTTRNLLIVTHAENMRLQRLRKPLCKRGHPFATEGGWSANGRRFCRTCTQLREARRPPRSAPTVTPLEERP